MRVLAGAALLTAALVLAGCGNVAVNHVPHQPEARPMKLAVFFDGTANDEGSYTNVAKLHNLVTLQARDDVSTSYIKGVGVDGKVLGMATGWGIGLDVRQAYLYLAENYRPERGDEIYIFGFSRGAYAARILAALIHVADIPDVSGMTESEQTGFIDALYNAYKSNGELSIAERKGRVEEVYRAYNKKGKETAAGRRTPNQAGPDVWSAHPRVLFLGIWDTVEALGWPDYEENVDVPNPRYADQLCNVFRAAHAVSIDDNRARIFTPILLTRAHLIRECTKVNIDKVVTEVWFSGAHADVGGGYKDTHISGVSLNWMIGQIRKAECEAMPPGLPNCFDEPPFSESLLPTHAAVYSDYAGKTHNPEADMSLFYQERTRDLDAYTSADGNHAGGTLKIHQSVVDRLAECQVEPHESQWFRKGKYNVCSEVVATKDKDKEQNKKLVFHWDRKACRDVVVIVDGGYRTSKTRASGNAGVQGPKYGELAADDPKTTGPAKMRCRPINDQATEQRASHGRPTPDAAGM